jgi:hypothetical protein
VVAWARGCNEQQGVAPSTEAMLQRLEEQRRRLPEAARPPPRGSSAEGKGRMCASRLRVRWGGRYGAIRVRDGVPSQEMRDKVVRMRCPSALTHLPPIVHIWVRFLGSVCATSKGSSRSRFKQAAGARKRTPVFPGLGPILGVGKWAPNLCSGF